MSSFVVDGGFSLGGSIATSGNKNEALPVIVAAMVCREPVVLSNLPDIGDVRSMLSIASHLGARVSELRNGTVTIRAADVPDSELPLEMSSAIRGSILFASALLVRTGKAVVPQPGGDSIGRRRLDTHFLVFKALGAKLTIRHARPQQPSSPILYILEARKGLRGADICLDEASVTATENAIIAAAGARGKTTIINAASEPHVQGLCKFFLSAGVRIEGVGSNVLTVYGADSIQGRATFNRKRLHRNRLLYRACRRDALGIDNHQCRHTAHEDDPFSICAAWRACGGGCQAAVTSGSGAPDPADAGRSWRRHTHRLTTTSGRPFPRI